MAVDLAQSEPWVENYGQNSEHCTRCTADSCCLLQNFLAKHKHC